MSEFQKGKISEIRGDHVERYKFAASRISGTVLDCGCGCGYGTWIMSEKSKFVLGVDKNPEALDYALKNYQGPKAYFHAGDITTIRGEIGFDYFVAFEVIEHLRQPAAALKRFAKAAGKLIMSVPNEENRPYDKNKTPFHYRHFTPDEILLMLQSSGWNNLKFYHQKDYRVGQIEDGAGGVTLIIEAESDNKSIS